MDTESFLVIYQSLQWLFSLGYVTILAIAATIFLVKLERKTILKKSLKGATAMQQDSILGFAGTVTSFIVFGVLHFANEMIIQGRFLIDFNTVTQSISIPSGAAMVWIGSKGIYTVCHKWWQRVKAGETMNWKQAAVDLANETKKPTLSISAAMPETTTKDNKIFFKLKQLFLTIKTAIKKEKTKVNTKKTIINRRSNEGEEV